MSKKKLLLTGAAGFIGSNILEKLVDKYEIIGVDNLSTGSKLNVEPFMKDFEFRLEDLRKYSVCEELTKDVDLVCHQAALPSVPRSIKNPRATNENNVTATVNLLKAAKCNGVKRVVYAASSSAYGDTTVLPKKEKMSPNPLSPYAVSKLAGEYYMKAFAKSFDIDTVSLRYFNVFGPRQSPKSQYAAVVPNFITAAINDKEITVHGDGKQSRDFSYIENVVSANILALENKKDLEGEVINVACGKRYTLVNLLDEIEDLTGKELNVTNVDSRVGDVKHSQADITKAIKLLKYKPKVDFKKGLKLSYKYYLGG